MSARDFLQRAILLALLFFASFHLYYKPDFLPLTMIFVAAAFFLGRPSVELVAVMNLAHLFTAQAYSEYAVHFRAELVEGTLPKLMLFHIGVYASIFAVIWALNRAPKFLKIAAFALTAMGFLTLVYLTLTQKSEIHFALMVFCGQYLYVTLAMIYHQICGRGWRAREIACNLCALFMLGTLPVPLLVSEFLGGERKARIAPDWTGILKAIVILAVVRRAIHLVFENSGQPFWKYLTLSVMPYSTSPPLEGFYDFSSFGPLERVLLLPSAHLFFMASVGSLVYWKVIVLKFFHASVPPQIQRPWAASSFYRHIASWVHHDNEVFVRLYIEPLAKCFKRSFLDYRYLAFAIFLFIALVVYHATNNIHGTIVYTWESFQLAYPSMILYSALIAFFVYLSAKFKWMNGFPAPARNAVYFAIYAVLGYIARDHFLIPLAVKLNILN